MPKAPFTDLLQYLRKVSDAHAARDLTDAELLERFQRQRDETAFSVLVHRHGPMVLGVCRRVLGDCHDAEDAFQAAFLVLVRRVASLSRTGSLPAWLHGVAERVAIRARNQKMAQRQRERQYQPMPTTEPIDDLAWQELRAVLDQEIAHLAEKYRAPLVLCHLEGKSYDQAARELGWSKTSLSRRLGQARELLQERLVRRGITLSAEALATILCEKVSGPAVGAMLTINTVKAAISIAAGKAVAAGCVSVQALALAEKTLTGIGAINLKLVAITLAIGVAVGGAGVASYSGLGYGQKPVKITQAPKHIAKSDKGVQNKTETPPGKDLYGDPLPEGALARLGTVRLRPDRVTSDLAFVQGGKLLASTGNGWIRIWDATTGRLVHRIPAESILENSFGLLPDGKVLITPALRLIDVATGKDLRQLVGPRDLVRVRTASFSLDGKCAAVSGQVAKGKEAVVIWSVVKDQEIGRLNAVGPVTLSPDGKSFVGRSQDKAICLWDSSTGRELRRFVDNEPLAGGVAFSPVAFSPDGKFLAPTGLNGGTIRVWEVETGKQIHVLRGDDATTIRQLKFSPNNKVLISGGQTGVIRCWDMDSGKQLRHWLASGSSIEAMALSPDGKVIATAGWFEPGIRMWDTATGKEINPAQAHTGVVVALSFGSDGNTLFSCGWDRKVLEWDLGTSRMRHRLFNEPIGPEDGQVFRGVFDLVPDGSILAAEFEPGNVGLWDTLTGKEIRTLKGNLGSSMNLKFSSDGKLLASAAMPNEMMPGESADNGIRIWEVATGKQLQTLGDKIGKKQLGGSAIAFSPDDKLLACASDKTISIWHIKTGQERSHWSYDGSMPEFRRLCFSRDGKLLAAASFDSVRVWVTATGKPLLQLDGDVILTMAFSPSGRIFAAAGFPLRKAGGGREENAPICLMDTLTGEEIRKIQFATMSVYGLAFAPDGRTLASGGGDSTILLWDLTGQGGRVKQKPAALTPKDLSSLWSDLRSNAATAERAIWALVLAPKQSMPLLQARMQTVARAPTEQVAKLVASLDDKTFEVRQKAAKALEEMWEGAETALRKTLEGNITLEVRQRVEKILAECDKEAIRKLRAIEVLEQIGTAEARDVLLALANATPNPRVADAAGAALQRLAKRPQ